MKRRNCNSINNMNIDRSKEKSNTTMLIYLVIAIIFMMFMYKVIEGINERNKANIIEYDSKDNGLQAGLS